MKTAILDEPLVIKKNSDFRFELDWIDPNRLNIDVSSFNVSMTLRRWEGEPSIITLSTDNNRATTAGNTMIFTAEAESTKDLDVCDPMFDISVTYNDENGVSKKVTVLTGTASIIADYS